MNRVRTFSRNFPQTHDEKGTPTNFVEKIYRSFDAIMDLEQLIRLNPDRPEEMIVEFWESLNHTCAFIPKFHTIRAGNHFSPGDFLVPKIWIGRPYHSKQIQFFYPIEIKKTLPIIIENTGGFMSIKIENDPMGIISLDELSQNDGLNAEQFVGWFREEKFEGQIICWSNKISY